MDNNRVQDIIDTYCTDQGIDHARFSERAGIDHDVAIGEVSPSVPDLIRVSMTTCASLDDLLGIRAVHDRVRFSHDPDASPGFRGKLVTFAELDEYLDGNGIR